MAQNFTQSSGLIPLSHALPWDTGSHYAFFWISYITVLVFGVLLNAATFLFMLLNKNIQRLTSVSTVKYLVIEDFFSSLVCLIQCCMNLHANAIDGDRTGCVIEAWQLSFFITITGYSLCLVSYIVRLNVTGPTIKKKARNVFIFKIQIVFWILGALFATGATVWPGTVRMNSSGTYCIAAFEIPWSAVFFFGVAVFPTVLFLGVQYLWIFIYVYQAKKSVECKLPSKRHHLRLARQLGSLVVIYFITYSPFMGSALYEWITDYYAPPLADFTGVLVHIASVANPIMYIWTSNQAKTEIFRIWNERMPIHIPRLPTDHTESDIPPLDRINSSISTEVECRED